jgi:hypothetical protein
MARSQRNEEPPLSPKPPQGAANRTPTCFVIGPIGNRHADRGTDERLAYEEAIQVMAEVIEPACEAVGLQPVRADGLSRAGEITDQVFRRLRDDDVVIADLTGANANVMYELGLRHTRNKLTVQVGEYGRLPFDINVIRTVMFSRSPHGLISARNELIGILETGLAGEFDLVGATRVWQEGGDSTAAIRKTTEDDQERSEGLESEEELGFIELLAAGEDGLERVVTATNAIAAEMAMMGQLAETSASKIERSDAQGRGMKGRLAIAVEYAAALSNVAEDLELSVEEYASAMSDVSLANFVIIERLEEDPSELEAAQDWARMTRRLATTARENMSYLNTLSDSVSENARVARALKDPSNRIVHALDTFAKATEVMDQWDRRLQALGVPVPPEDWEPAVPEETEGRANPFEEGGTSA